MSFLCHMLMRFFHTRPLILDPIDSQNIPSIPRTLGFRSELSSIFKSCPIISLNRLKKYFNQHIISKQIEWIRHKGGHRVLISLRYHSTSQSIIGI